MSKAIETTAEVNLLLNEVNDVLAKTKDYSMINEAEFDVQYPTGFLSFDYKACGKIINVTYPDGSKTSYDSIGIVDGAMYMIIGRSGCGKSTYGVQISANIIRNFLNGIMFVDITEATGMMKDRLQDLTGFSDEEF